jgi:predicted dehydrogenase
MMMKQIRIGMIGLDTSHCTAFTELLHDDTHPFHVPGGKVEVAYPGGSPDFPLSAGRVKGISRELEEKHSVQLVESPEAVAETVDAILLTSVDGRVHAEQFQRIAPYQKPVFIDKPLAVNSKDAETITKVAASQGVPWMSASALRYAEPLVQLSASVEEEAVSGADCYGPMQMEPTQPGFFWYGIHTVEMLYALMGPGCSRVATVSTADHDVITGIWEDGRIGTVRGNRVGNVGFGGAVHLMDRSLPLDCSAAQKPYYAGLLERVMHLFRTGEPLIDPAETLEVIRFIEAANESRSAGCAVDVAVKETGG